MAVMLGLLLMMIVAWPVNGNGINIGLEQSMLNLGARIALDQMTKEIDGKTLPNYRRSSLSVTNIRVRMQPIRNHDIVLSNGEINMSFFTSVLSVSANWRYSRKIFFVRVSTSGSVKGSISSLRISAKARLVESGSGGVTVKIISNTAKVSGLKLRFSRNLLSWVLNVIGLFFRGDVSRRIEKAVTDAMPKGVGLYNQKLLTAPRFASVANVLRFNYTLTGPPTIGDRTIVIPIDGGVSLPSGGPIGPSLISGQGPVPAPRQSDKELCFNIGSYPLDTLFLAVFSQYGDLVTITSDMLPAEYREQACFDDGELGKLLGTGNRIPSAGCLKVSASLRNAFRTTIGNDALGITVQLNLKFYHVYQGRETLLFNIISTVQAAASPDVSDDSIVLIPTALRFGMQLEDSLVGPIPVDRVAGVLNQILEAYIQGHAQELRVLGRSYNLPLPKVPGTVHLTNTEISIIQNAIEVCADVQVEV